MQAAAAAVGRLQLVSGNYLPQLSTFFKIWPLKVVETIEWQWAEYEWV